MFSTKQDAENEPLCELSFATFTPGAVANNTTVGVAQAFTLASPGSSSPATFALGDTLTIVASAATSHNGLLITASPTATQGTAQVYFQNTTGGSITPVSGKYLIQATRFPPNIVV